MRQILAGIRPDATSGRYGSRETVAPLVSGDVALPVSLWSGRERRAFDRKQMESLIAQVRLRAFIGDEQLWWKMVSGSATIVPEPYPKWTAAPGGGVVQVPRPDGRARMLYARRTPEGKLTVVIMTEWGSHASHQAGSFTTTHHPSNTLIKMDLFELDVPGSDLGVATSRQIIDAHWREVYNPNTD